ncbi:MAG: TrkA C-terminal domain-containing protein [Bacteroidales bacterium]
MIITGTLTFLFGQYIGIQPVYHKLYQLMLDDEKDQFNKMIQADFEVSSDSILIGKELQHIELPAGSKITGIRRKEKTPLPLMPDQKLNIGDLIEIEVPEQDYEKLFKVFRTLTNE